MLLIEDKKAIKKRARASNDLTIEEPQPADGDTCADIQSDFMDCSQFVEQSKQKTRCVSYQSKTGGTSLATLVDTLRCKRRKMRV